MTSRFYYVGPFLRYDLLTGLSDLRVTDSWLSVYGVCTFWLLTLLPCVLPLMDPFHHHWEDLHAPKAPGRSRQIGFRTSFSLSVHCLLESPQSPNLHNGDHTSICCLGTSSGMHNTYKTHGLAPGNQWADLQMD